MLSADLLETIAAEIGEPVEAVEPVASGSLSAASRLRLDSGRLAFLKTDPASGAEELLAEAASLDWLAAAGAARVPEVLGAGTDPEPWLAMQWVEPGRLSSEGAEELGRSLARLHRSGVPGHGAMPPGSPDSKLRIGPVHLPLDDAPADWPSLYAERLILPTARMARERGALDASDVTRMESLCERIGEVVGPEEPPSRLHGDLWSGNVHSDSEGSPWLIDPIAYGGHREVDLAMLELFGSPGGRTMDAYQEEHPLPDGHRKRVALWQLFPLLVHAVLFGGGYGSRASSVAARYT